MALSTDYALRTGAFEPADATVNAQDLQGSCKCEGEGDQAAYMKEPVLLPSGWISNQSCPISLIPHTCTVKELKERALSRYNLVRVSMCHQHAAPAQDSFHLITETPQSLGPLSPF